MEFHTVDHLRRYSRTYAIMRSENKRISKSKNLMVAIVIFPLRTLYVPDVVHFLILDLAFICWVGFIFCSKKVIALFKCLNNLFSSYDRVKQIEDSIFMLMVWLLRR